MAITRVFNGMTMRVPGNYGGISTEQRITMRFRRFLFSLGVKSAGYRSDRVVTGGNAVLKINGREIAYAGDFSYDIKNIGDTTSDGSKS